MSPYRIDMVVNSYTEEKEPLYFVKIYDREGKVIKSSGNLSKEKAVIAIANYCGVCLDAEKQGLMV